jgi:hypothetical protein
VPPTNISIPEVLNANFLNDIAVVLRIIIANMNVHISSKSAAKHESQQHLSLQHLLRNL